MAVIRNIILDWSGTLVDDFQPVVAATNEIFVRYGKPAFTAAQFREHFKLPFADFYAEHLPEATMVELDHIYHTSFQLLQTTIDLLPEAREFLDYCRDRALPMFLLSTIHHEHFKVQGERLGVRDYFKQAYVEAFDKRKTILHLLAEHDLDPAETMFIGDMVHDIDTARHGGVTSCAVLTGYDSLEKLKGANPDLIFRRLGQVRDHLERHRGEERKAAPPVGTVGALIFNDADEVLLVHTHKWSDLWGIPGGKIQGNERSEDALRRETREETGLELTEVEFVVVQDCIESPEFYRKVHFLLLNYTARAVPGQPVILNDEADQFCWMAPEKALTDLPINTPTRLLIETVLAARR